MIEQTYESEDRGSWIIGGWFESLGKPVSPERKLLAVILLASLGYDAAESEITVMMVAREMEHDNPERCYRFMRSLCGDDEILVIRVLATLCGSPARSDEELEGDDD